MPPIPRRRIGGHRRGHCVPSRPQARAIVASARPRPSHCTRRRLPPRPPRAPGLSDLDHCVRCRPRPRPLRASPSTGPRAGRVLTALASVPARACLAVNKSRFCPVGPLSWTKLRLVGDWPIRPFQGSAGRRPAGFLDRQQVAFLSTRIANKSHFCPARPPPWTKSRLVGDFVPPRRPSAVSPWPGPVGKGLSVRRQRPRRPWRPCLPAPQSGTIPTDGSLVLNVVARRRRWFGSGAYGAATPGPLFMLTPSSAWACVC